LQWHSCKQQTWTCVALACIVCTSALRADPAGAQTYPARTIRIITSGVGGGNDFISRLIAQGITGPLGQAVVVENRPNTIVMAQDTIQASADGYTLLLASSSLWIIPLLQKSAFDALRDFTPVTMIDRAPNILVVHPSLPAQSVADLIALAKRRPGELNYGSGGPGTSAQLAAELFKSMAGVKIVGINYKGSGPQLNALIGGEVQLSFATATAVTPFLKSGRLRALATTSLEPTPLLPGMATVAGSGVPGYEAGSIDGLFVKAGTPAAIVHRLNQEVVRYISQPAMTQKFYNSGIEIVGSSPEQFSAAIKSETVRMDKVIKDAGIRLD
jgi:tripartite-type tricarboxylate transporter receptor subunit TctC